MQAAAKRAAQLRHLSGGNAFLGLRYAFPVLGASPAKTGSQVLVPLRGLEDSPRHLKLMGDLGQVGASVLYGMGGQKRFSTIGEDPDTHSDFKAVNKALKDVPSARELVEEDVKNNPIMLYMKGVPSAPRCGFSALAVKVLQEYGVPFHARNILEDQELKESIKYFSNWPTFPQIFIKGEFVGGSDIILNMHQSGELKEMLKDLSPVNK